MILSTNDLMALQFEDNHIWQVYFIDNDIHSPHIHMQLWLDAFHAGN